MVHQTNNTSFVEFVFMMGLMTAMTALAIDATLPALGEIGQALNIIDKNDNQLIISIVFAGMAIGQIIYGPLSDSIGRKNTIYIGFIFYITGCFFSIYSTVLTTMLSGRFLQGLGAAGPRIVSMALILGRSDLIQNFNQLPTPLFISLSFIPGISYIKIFSIDCTLFIPSGWRDFKSVEYASDMGSMNWLIAVKVPTKGNTGMCENQAHASLGNVL